LLGLRALTSSCSYYGENIIVIGNASVLGDNNIANAPPLSANTYPIWNTDLQLPVNSTFSYQYVRTESDGTFIYENTVRTFTTGTCDGVVKVINDNITTVSGPHKRGIESVDTASTASPFEIRQSSGNMLGLPGRDLLNPPYMIKNAAGVLSSRTINTDLIHANGLAEYDTHNL